MQRYLVYDSGCSVCAGLAEKVQEATGGKVEAISIRDDETKALLDKAHPKGWQYAPYFMTVHGDKVQAWTGTSAALRLGLLMGPPKALKVWRIAQQSGTAVPGGNLYAAPRRQLFKLGARVAAVAATSGFIAWRADSSADAQTSYCNCYNGCCLAQAYSAYCCGGACGLCPGADVTVCLVTEDVCTGACICCPACCIPQAFGDCLYCDCGYVNNCQPACCYEY